jgi:pimeloyl-ACP methyl ester carboxylesterase
MTSIDSPRRLTTRRIVALALIAAVAAGLGFLRFHQGEDDVRVPAGAHAGQLTMHPCTYPTEKGDLKADCGTLVVAENRHDPHSRLIALRAKRIRARAPNPAEPIFRLEGGPGKTNMDFPYAHRYIEHHDLVLVGYRGVDGSSRLDCPEVEDARRTSGDLLSAHSLQASTDAFGDCARRLTNHGTDLAGYSMTQRVEDFEDARRALHYDRINLLSESAGTRTATIYAWRHPKSIRRSVMAGVNPPGRFLYRQAETAAQLERFDAMAHDDVTTPLKQTTDDIPAHWGPLPIESGNVKLASFFGLMESSTEGAPISAPMTLDAWKRAGDGDASGLWFQSLASALLFPRAQVWGDSAAIAGADAVAAKRHFAQRPANDESPLGDAPNRFLWADGGMLREWPTSHDDDAYARIRTSNVETLLVSGSVDGATPLSQATRDLLKHLPNGHQVVLEGLGHTTDFWTQQPDANARLVNTFMDDGEVDDSLYKPQRVDFTPDTTQSFIAKLVAGTMLLFALIAAISLLWLAVRARAGRILGVKRSAVVRSVLATVVGLGAWFAAALTAMVALPDTPIDDELLVVLSVGIPVGLAVHWGANGRGRASLVAIAGAILGAWLGFEAPGSPIGLLVAIPAAVAAANLAAIVGDMAAAPATTREPARHGSAATVTA